MEYVLARCRLVLYLTYCVCWWEYILYCNRDKEPTEFVGCTRFITSYLCWHNKRRSVSSLAVENIDSFSTDLMKCNHWQIISISEINKLRKYTQLDSAKGKSIAGVLRHWEKKYRRLLLLTFTNYKSCELTGIHTHSALIQFTSYLRSHHCTTEAKIQRQSHVYIGLVVLRFICIC